MSKYLIQKYNIAGPRYTSYPTVPFWNKEGIDYENWINSTQRAFIENDLTSVFDNFSEAVSHSENKELNFLSLANTRARLRMTTLYHYAQINGFLASVT